MKRTILSRRHIAGLLGLCYLVFALPSCSKSFLNQVPKDGTPTVTAITSEATMYTAILGLYSSMRATDFYGRTYAIKGDLMADNAFLSSANSGRYLGFNNYDMDKTNAYPRDVWSNAYAGIKNANFIINCGLQNTNNPISHMYAEAYALRGLFLFDLARNYSMPYAAGVDNDGVPIVKFFDYKALPARSKVGEVYAQILSDLDSALLLSKYAQTATMTFSSTGVNRVMNYTFVTKYVIEALQARVYQHMGNWQAVHDKAQDIVDNGGYSLTTSTALVGYWQNAGVSNDKIETMFEVTSDANNNVSDGTLANIYVPKPLGSYGDILATKAFYNTYTSTDARRSLYNPSTRSGQLGTAYYVTKYPIDVVNYDDVKIVRYAEVLLTLAESYYNLSDETNALKYLNMVAMQRDPSFAGYASTGAQVLEDILNERAKELAFEGYRFWDLYRLQRPFVHPQSQDAANAINKSVSVTPGNTPNFIFPIPNNERLLNPNISQNAGY